MKKAAQYIILYIIGTIVFYLISVLTLFILINLFNDSFENIWLSAIPVTIMAELMLCANFVWKKYKTKNKK